MFKILRNVIVAFTSGSKGGTGKSTLSVLTTILLSAVLDGKKILLIDFGEHGNSTRMILKHPEPPFLTDFLKGNIKAIGRYRLKIGRIESKFFMIPNLGKIQKLSNIEIMLKKISRIFDYIICDLPAYQNSLYDCVIDLSDMVVLVTLPNLVSIEAIKRAYTGKAKRVVVLNKYFKSAFQFKIELEKYFDEIVLTIPFDPYVSIMNANTLPIVLKKLSKNFQKHIADLCYVISSYAMLKEAKIA